MRQFLLAAVLIAAPVGIFAAGYHFLAPASQSASQGLGDMSKFIDIVTDVQSIAAAGDFASAEKRVRDYESAWDQAETGLRPLDGAAWTAIDKANDAAFSSLRASSPNAQTVTASLAAVIDALKSGGQK